MSEPAQPTTRLPLWPLGIIAVLAAVLLVAWVATSSDGSTSGGVAEAETFTLIGQVELAGAGTFTADDGEDCTGKDSAGYPDIKMGTAVTVYDAAGKVIAMGSLGKGAPVLERYPAPCVFPFIAPSVPAGESFYQVEVASRGRVAIEAADAEAGLAALTLG